MVPLNSAFPIPDLHHPNGVQLGGLGTGRIELGRNGRITLAGITNNWQRLLAGLDGCFFSLRQADEKASRFHLLQDTGLDGQAGVKVSYRGEHPLAEVIYTIPESRLEVGLTAFSPLVPHDLPNSSIPGAVFRFKLTNHYPHPLQIMLGFSFEHLMGCGGWGNRGLSLTSNRTGNRIVPVNLLNAQALHFTGGNDLQHANARGEICLATSVEESMRIWTYQTWNLLRDRQQVLQALAEGALPERFDAGHFAEQMERDQRKRSAPPSWDDPDPRFGGARTGIEGAVHPCCTLGVECTLAPGATVEIPFVLSWHNHSLTTRNQPDVNHGHFYRNRFNSALESAQLLLEQQQSLHAATRELHHHMHSGDLPAWLARKILNDNTALTTNSIVTAAGSLYTLEASPMMFGALGTLDQRLVAHPGYSLLYPELNRTELRSFAVLQAADGSLPHFNGNAHTALNSADVEYGTTGWPDLACSFIIQCYRDWSETGDNAFISEMSPHIRRATEWLLAADRDGDGVPEGGSSWDIEHYSGCFIATATVWLATLRVLHKLTSVSPRLAPAEQLTAFFDRASNTVEAMWNGRWYLKYHDSRSGKQSNDFFIGQLAGEWIVQQLGLPSILPRQRVLTTLENIYRLHGNRQHYKLMPIQVQPDGTMADRKYAWHAWPQYSMVFVDCLALYMGMSEPAMDNIAAFDHVVCHINRSPWATTLWHDARTGLPDFGGFMGMDWYMNTPASWWALYALTGFTAMENEQSICLGPAVISSQQEWHLPIVTPRYWATLYVKREDRYVSVRFTPTWFFRGDALTLRNVVWRGAVQSASIGGMTCAITSFSDTSSRLMLAYPLTLKSGDSLRFNLTEV
jgi:non-lysosomal glucosylceramidase